MRERCNNPNHNGYRYYGGRGISVCQRWDHFPLFALDVGERPSPQHTLDRVDGSKCYAPDNVRWATREEQNKNRMFKRIPNMLTVLGLED